MIFFIIVSALVILSLVVWFYFFKMAFVRRKTSDIENLNSRANRPLLPYRDIVESGMEFIRTKPHQTITVNSFDGLRLFADYYENPGSNTTMLLFHGYRSAGKRDFCCAVKMYYEMGMNVLLVDQRSHSRSEGKLITFGVKERKDVLSWVDLILRKFPVNSIMLGGMSMGATTVLLSAGLDLPENVKGIIADCGFTSPEEIICEVARKSFRINARPLMPFLDILCRIFGKFSFRGISTVKSLSENERPVLIIHGNDDNFVPVEMSKRSYNAMKSERKYICLVDGANHGFSFLVDPKRVSGELERFISECCS